MTEAQKPSLVRPDLLHGFCLVDLQIDNANCSEKLSKCGRKVYHEERGELKLIYDA